MLMILYTCPPICRNSEPKLCTCPVVMQQSCIPPSLQGHLQEVLGDRSAHHTPTPHRRSRASAAKAAAATPHPYERQSTLALHTVPLPGGAAGCYVLVLTSKGLDCWQVRPQKLTLVALRVKPASFPSLVMSMAARRPSSCPIWAQLPSIRTSCPSYLHPRAASTGHTQVVSGPRFCHWRPRS